MLKNVEISRAMSHALRHEPWVYELELDDEGWAPVEVLLEAFRQMGPEWRAISRHDLERVIDEADKKRHALVGDRVRALYGHSIPGQLNKEVAVPPPILFHGTSVEAAWTIKHEGLRPMSRQYVHLSVDIATALEVGRRKSDAPVLFAIEARAAHDDGVAFYAGNERVWLAELVPSRFMRVATR